MKAALFPEKGKIVFTDIPKPELSENHAIIKVKYGGICGTDVNVWKGLHQTATYPRVPGHELVGTVEAFDGQAKMDLQVGDLVVVQPFNSCGICEPCVSGKSNVCRSLSILGIHQDGGFAEYLKMPINKVYKLPKDMDPKVAALTEPLAVAVHDVRESGIKVGQKVLIIGGGPIGMLIALVAREAGANKVFISEINENRIEFIKSMGFEAINPMKEDIIAVTQDQTNGKGFDAVFEVSGSQVGIATMTDVVKIGGVAMVIGMSATKPPVDTTAMFFKELTLKGVRLHSEEAFANAVDIISSGKLQKDLSRLVDKEFPLSQIEEALNYQLEDKEHFKVLIDISK